MIKKQGFPCFFYEKNYGVYSLAGKAPGCELGSRRFEPGYTPQIEKVLSGCEGSLVAYRPWKSGHAGSNPASQTNLQ